MYEYKSVAIIETKGILANNSNAMITINSIERFAKLVLAENLFLQIYTETNDQPYQCHTAAGAINLLFMA